MKRKIVIIVPMHREKDRSRAMKIAVSVPGVISVDVGEEGDRLVVTGDGVDAARLANSLCKKFCYADIVRVEEMAPPIESPTISPPPSPSPPCPPWYPPPFIHPPPCPPVCYYDAGPPSCSIL